ncbi:MAG: hypothetical protein WCB26_23710, partial [Pseudolabrys sp.]
DDTGTFDITQRGRTITWMPGTASAMELVRADLLGGVFSVALHLSREALFVAVSLLSPFDCGIQRVQCERQALDRGIDCALLRHRLWPTPKTCAAADI